MVPGLRVDLALAAVGVLPVGIQSHGLPLSAVALRLRVAFHIGAVAGIVGTAPLLALAFEVLSVVAE